MTVPYTSLAVANSFIDKFGRQDGIEHMKLQKLVYCSYGWWLATKGMVGVRLTTEGPEIWRHGPVFNSLYRAMKVFGRQGIKSPQSADPFSDPVKIDQHDKEVSSLIVWVWGRYGHLSSFALSDMTHKHGTPWHRVAAENNFEVAHNTKIPDGYIYEEFHGLLEAGNRAKSGVTANGREAQHA